MPALKIFEMSFSYFGSNLLGDLNKLSYYSPYLLNSYLSVVMHDNLRDAAMEFRQEGLKSIRK